MHNSWENNAKSRFKKETKECPHVLFHINSSDWILKLNILSDLPEISWNQKGHDLNTNAQASAGLLDIDDK